MIRFLLFFIGLQLLTPRVEAQNKLSAYGEISVLTIGPGTSLNDAFGHSAFRVFDPVYNFDIVFDYGRYDFETEGFYLKFVQGKLNYKIGWNQHQSFIDFYKSSDRSIKEQLLNLDPEQKNALYHFLRENTRPENQYYLYDFFYDNCATKIKDVISSAIDDEIIYNPTNDFTPETFRALIHSHLHQNSWGSLGIDLALGSVIDRKASIEQHLFLPKNLHYFFQDATLKSSNQNLIEQARVVYEKQDPYLNNSIIFSPLLIFTLIAIIIAFITYRDLKTQNRTKWLDVLVFLATGLIGCVILLLWFATDHSTTAFNYNFLWAFALNLFMIPIVLKNKIVNWFLGYLKFLLICMTMVFLHWLTGVQWFAIGLLPLLLILPIRYLFLIHYYNTLKTLSKKPQKSN